MASEENPVVRAALSLLAYYGVEAWRNQAVRVPGRHFNGRKGVSDILGVTCTGRFVAIECKKPGGKVSPEQRAFLDMVQARGGVGIVLDSIEAAVETLKALKDSGEI